VRIQAPRNMNCSWLLQMACNAMQCNAHVMRDAQMTHGVLRHHKTREEIRTSSMYSASL